MQPTILARGAQIMIVQRDGWGPYYEAEKRSLEKAAGELFLALEHVGSTAVAGLATKPVIDILAGARSLEDGVGVAAKLSGLGYVQLPFRPVAQTPESTERLFFLRRGADTAEGVDVDRPGYNLHVVPIEWFYSDDQILFRDYLRAHSDVAEEYGRLKCAIVARISDYRDYLPGKHEFIQRVLAEARAERR